MSRTPPTDQRLGPDFYNTSTVAVAKALIGQVLLHRFDGRWIGGPIVETEAYLHRGDPASHSARGRTPANASMFGGPGTLYVYSIHAKFCLNAVTGPVDRGAAVLIRAIEPVWGCPQMQQHRGKDQPKQWTRGPAMLCQALGIDRSDDGRSLVTDPALGIFADPDAARRKIRRTRRIGISKAVERKLRFVDPDSAYLSRRYRGSAADRP